MNDRLDTEPVWESKHQGHDRSDYSLRQMWQLGTRCVYSVTYTLLNLYLERIVIGALHGFDGGAIAAKV